ncbi:Hypothetical predicted protein, partial [Mytilus galloprovincialis]
KDRSITMFKESLEITVAIGLGLAVGRLITSGIPEKRKPKGDGMYYLKQQRLQMS